jgi:single-strand DNA-binding protein
MTDLNHVIEIGRLTRDISERDFAYTTGGTARLNLSIAVNRSEKRGGEWADKVSFFDVTVWGKTAENIKPYLYKGKQIAIDGYLDQQRWEKDGQKFSKVVIIADSVQLLGNSQDGPNSARNGGTSAPQTQQPAGDYQSAGSGDDFPEDIPF